MAARSAQAVQAPGQIGLCAIQNSGAYSECFKGGIP